ncbi:hypothetical protein D5275_00250 [Adlercreutzia muris]|nr:hypothetical protein [Adlercreutzia muris]
MLCKLIRTLCIFAKPKFSHTQFFGLIKYNVTLLLTILKSMSDKANCLTIRIEKLDNFANFNLFVRQNRIKEAAAHFDCNLFVHKHFFVSECGRRHCQ